METYNYTKKRKKTPEHQYFWRVVVWWHQTGTSNCQVLPNTSGYMTHTYTAQPLTWNVFYMLVSMGMFTCEEERVSVLRRRRRERWWRWWGPSPLVLDWQPWGLGKVGRNWSRRMLLEVWRALFNKTEPRLKLPCRNLSTARYNFFPLKIQLLYELSPIICAKWQPLLSHSFTMEESLNPSTVSWNEFTMFY